MRKPKAIVKSAVKSLIPQRLISQKLNAKGKGAILLTFDDGPDPDVTPHLLDLLQKYDARAMFFIPGSRIERAPSLLKEILRKGHVLGNHTDSHAGVAGLSFRQYRDEILNCQKKIFAITGESPRYFRPPEGIITLPMIYAAKSTQLKIVRWSVETGEYSYMTESEPDVLASNLIQIIESRSIVLSHDDNKKIPQLYEIVLPKLKEMGFNLHKGLDYLD